MSTVAIIGGGPAGLIAAEHLSARGHAVTVYDRMPSLGRKFLLAGRGGLNLTHAEPLEVFLGRYREAAPILEPLIRAFDPAQLRDWCQGFGQETFVGSSGRVFPKAFKASPLLRAWLRRLEAQGVAWRPGHRWTGWTEAGALCFETAGGRVEAAPDATILALGGASWPRLGSDGGWTATLSEKGVAVATLRPANAGVEAPWSAVLKERFAGAPLKRIALAIGGETALGEAVLTAEGLEGGAVYALSAPIRAALDRDGFALLSLDLRPDLGSEAVAARLSGGRKGESFANRLRKSLALAPVAVALLREADRAAADRSPAALAELIKALPVTVTGLRPIERAISTAGGVRLGELDGGLMLRRLPGVFCAGEMLDWEAPTGGYLLQACFATGLSAARGVEAWLKSGR
jgi:hypothetical protein